ncbi:MAG: cytochrome P450 [Pseudomonadota bacterium]
MPALNEELMLPYSTHQNAGFPELTLSPRDEQFFLNPYETYREWHDAGWEVFWWHDYQMWCVCSFDLVARIFRDRRFGRQISHKAARHELGLPERPQHLANFDRVELNSLLELEPPKHTRIRRQVNRAFFARAVDRLRPQIATDAQILIDSFEARGHAEVLEEFIAPLAVGTTCRLLGVDQSSADRLRGWSHAMVKMYVANPALADQLAADEAARQFSDWVRAEISNMRRASENDSLLFELLSGSDTSNALTDDEIVSTVVLLLNAGHEATVHQFGNGMATAWAQRGPEWPSLFETPAKTAATVDEFLRFNPPLHMFTRYALQDISLQTKAGELELKFGDQVGLLLGAANRDPNKFDAPNSFNPDRSDQATAAFGAGIHFCVGTALAKIELQEAFSAMASRLPHARFENGPRCANSFHFHGLESALLRW